MFWVNAILHLIHESDTVLGGIVYDLEKKVNNERFADHTELLRSVKTSEEWEKLQVDLPKAGEWVGWCQMKCKMDNHQIRRNNLNFLCMWLGKEKPHVVSYKTPQLKAWW